MEADRFVRRWLILSHDRHQDTHHGTELPPWADLLPEMSSFEIIRNENDEYWLIPPTPLGASRAPPMKLEWDASGESAENLGEKLQGSFGITLPDPIGRLVLTFNQIGNSRLWLSISHQHVSNTGDIITTSVKHGGSHGVDD